MNTVRSPLLVIAVVLAACSSGVPATTAPPSPPALVGPPREPQSLSVLPQEQAVLDAFKASGMQIALVGGSKAEGQLGRVLPARVFIGPRIAPQQGGFGDGADVLFLPAGETWDIRVCETASATAPRMLYVLYVNGTRVGGSDAANPIHHLVGDRFFAIAYSDQTANALRSGLGLSQARC